MYAVTACTFSRRFCSFSSNNFSPRMPWNFFCRLGFTGCFCLQHKTQSQQMLTHVFLVSILIHVNIPAWYWYIYFSTKHPSMSLFPTTSPLQVFYGPPVGLSLHFIIHAFHTDSFSPFLETCPYHLNLFCCITVTI